MTEKEEKMLNIFKQEVEKEQKEYEQVNEYTKFFYNNHREILNLIKNQQKEISELKAKYDKDTHTLQNQLDVANADRVEKDKIIKAMAKYINSTDKDEDVCRETGDTFNCTEYRNCEECIINFFKKKVSEEKIK